MADKYAYVDPVSGNDGTGVSSTTPATAAASPYKTLFAAELANRQNLTTLDGSFIFRCLQGVEISSATLEILTANWPGSTDARRVVIEGFGTGKHNGLFSESVGYTLRYTGGTSAISHAEDMMIALRDFRVRNTNANYAYAHSSAYGACTMDRMLLYSAAGQTISALGGDAADRRLIMRSCVVLSATDIALFADGSNDNWCWADNCTFIGNHATNPTVMVGANHRLRWNYSHNAGAGGCYGGAGWATTTRVKNASSDATGDSTYTSVAYSTSAGAYFTNVTGGSENFDISASSFLLDKATDSGETVDVLGRARGAGSADIGAFEALSGGTGTMAATESGSDTFASTGGLGSAGIRLTLRDTDTGALAASLTGLIVSIRTASNSASLLANSTSETTDGSGVLEFASGVIGTVGTYVYVTVEKSDNSIVATYRVQVVDLNA